MQRLAEQTVVVPVDESDVATIGPEVAAGAGGVILFGTTAPSGLAASLQSLDSLAPGGIAPFVMSDEEGGVVQRMANLVGSVPSAREMGATMTPTEIGQLAMNLGEAMRRAGVTMDLPRCSTSMVALVRTTPIPTARARSAHKQRRL